MTDTSLTRAFIGLGSNLDNPLEQVTQAMKELADIPDTKLVKRSALYVSTAIGQANQPDYINAAIEISTQLDAQALLDATQHIENMHLRKREVHWGPRTLDLDILLFGDHTISTERLVIPHPEITNRNFVVRPLLDLDSNLCLPDGRKLVDILPIIGLGGLKRLENSSHQASMME